MRRLGVHTSIGGGLHLSLRRAHRLGCTTVQIFTHNPRAWATSPIGETEKNLFRKLRKDLDLSPVYAHASYLINIASGDNVLREKSVRLLAEEMKRADELGADFVVLHTGVAHDPEGRRRAAESIRKALRRKLSAGLLIENTSGKRGDIASSIREMAWLIEHTDGLIRGICMDSCHAFAAGYDIRTREGLKRLSDEIKQHLGTDMLKLIHLNDSKGAAGSRIDRHEHIGMGKIGAAALKRFIRHAPFRDIPIVLETPKENDTDDIENLKRVRRMLFK